MRTSASALLSFGCDCTKFCLASVLPSFAASIMPGGLVVVDKKGDVVLKHSETQPGDHVDWKKLTGAGAALGLK